MKKFEIRIILFWLFILVQAINAQVVITDPLLPTENDSIVVIYDATQGNQGLMNYNGTVYAHTGVITNFSNSLSDWKHVIGDWGDNTTQPQLSYIGNKKYKLVIGNPREYYGLTSNSGQIEKLAFVFRSADGNLNGKDVGNADIFADIYEEGLAASIIKPATSIQFVELNDQIEILATSEAADSLKLIVNDEVVASTAESSIQYNLTITEARTYWIVARASTVSGDSFSDTVCTFMKGETVIEPVPEGMVQGINYISDSEVTLVLWAPEKEFVFAGGDFNDWQYEPEYQMKRDPDGETYWITLTGLTPQKEYAYQYAIDGEMVVPDSYADKILDPWHDGGISESVYPNLKPYPGSKAWGILSVFQTAQPEYDWEINNFEKPPKEKLVVYELLIRDFVSTHYYQTLIDTLDYLENLGVTAIDLMPVNEFEGNSSWGYNPMVYFAPDKYYGTKNDLKEFIDEAHKRGMAVIMDIVLNHAYGSNPMVQMYWDGPNNRPAENNPWFNVESPNTVFYWGNDFNHESQHTKDFIDRVNSYWLTEYKFDGFRFDFTKGFTNTSGDGGAYDASRISILKRMADEIWKVDSDAYVILEHFTAYSEEEELSDYGMMIWGNINHNYNEATMGYHDSFKSNFKGVSYKVRGWSDPHLVGYMESHDEERLMFKNLEYGNEYDSYSIKDLNTALNRNKMAASFFITVPGPKMIWQFGEMGYDYSINYPSGTEDSRTHPKPIRWDYLENEERYKLMRVYQELNNLKKNYEVFSTDDFGMFVVAAMKRIHLNHESMNVTILGNFNVIGAAMTPNFQHTGKWYDFFSGDSIEVTDINEGVFLKAGEFHIYSDEKLPSPEDDIITGVESFADNDVPDEYELMQNYPNPFNPATIIQYNIPVAALSTSASLSTGSVEGLQHVTLKVYDILGREVAVLVNENQVPGNYRVQFNGSNLSSGVYFYKLKAGFYTRINKMLLLR